MRNLHSVYHLARADFLERTRRTSFLVMVGLVLYLGYLVNIGQVTLRLETYRGVFNSAWVGSMMTLVVNFLLGWFGFYLVKGAIARDYQTGVGQIMAATPLSRPLYLLGKWLSNMAVLDLMVFALMIAALVMQLIQREDAVIHVWALISPFLLVALPFMALVAAIAVLFECISWLRGSFGNLVYFFGFIMGIALVAIMFGEAVPVLDWLGFGVFKTSMAQAAKAAYPDYSGGLALSLVPASGNIQPFHWAGVTWTLPLLLPRLGIWALALGLTLASSVVFDRFSQAGMPRRKKSASPAAEVPATAAAPAAAQKSISLTRLPAASARFSLGRLFLAEWRLTVRGMPWWWYLAALGLIGGSLVLPLENLRSWVLPAALIWPLLVWSGLGCREARYATGQFVFSGPRPLRSQLPAAWLAGMSLSLLMGGGALLRFALAGDWTSFTALAAGLLFIPSLALALGVWTGSSKAFEVVYAVFWYLGVLNDVLELDFTGLHASGHWPIYLFLSLALFALAFWGRKRQLQH
ncbi:ABC transporter permease [Levilinea saccharolytica]|uniref:Uncharacterized protein n=1 Tax=Levilinea saccharolytica TaxID=229921 RepID=A0A0P6YMF3_9CHLR|nr:hypothetical protein [Levilinea saccharolytica]KPL91804.1 hypothetical protein ADN01_00540 [Levilinea saccharolytica]GAP17617.1 hypothetical protein LSAC_01492 [Levilinea saccharolytica]